MTAGDEGDDDGLPPPEIETIRNLVGNAWHSFSERGALLKLEGAGIRDNSVGVAILAPILEHFDRLLRITQAHRAGFEVKRRGPITEVKGFGHLAAMAPVPGSYAIPLRLDPPQGEMFAEERDDLEEVVRLMAADRDTLNEMLRRLPERTGDELVNLLKVADAGRVDLGVVVLSKRTISAQVDLGAQSAGQLAKRLEEPQSSDAGRQVLRGTLWRIDTKHRKITIDAAAATEDMAIVATVDFVDSQLDGLREALREHVEVEVSVIEQRRSYEQTARKQEMKLLALKPWNPVGEAQEAQAAAETDIAAEPAAEAAADDAESI